MKYKLLIIEDDPFISRSIKAALQEKGFDIVGIAKTVKKAEELLALKKPDLSLIDIQLKGKESGTEFAKTLDTLQLPYFYLTAQTDPLTLSEVSKTKPLGYIVKPFTASGLWSSISITWQQYLNDKEKTLTIKVDGYIHRISENDILFLEQEIDAIEKQLPSMTHFILPGGHQTVSFCHIARCVCRRAERLIVGLQEEESIHPVIIKYINRLSDYLFVLARKLTKDLSVQETKWIPEVKN
jgi:ATP:cob(I)alamin adenosyltransferase